MLRTGLVSRSAGAERVLLLRQQVSSRFRLRTSEGPSKAITFRSILPALVFIVALNLSYFVLKGPIRNVILAYGHLWNAMFLAFPLAHIIARRASLREGLPGPRPFKAVCPRGGCGGSNSKRSWFFEAYRELHLSNHTSELRAHCQPR